MSGKQDSAVSGVTEKKAASEVVPSFNKSTSANTAKRIVFRSRSKCVTEDEQPADTDNIQSVRNFRNFPSKLNPPSTSHYQAETLFHLRGKSGYLPAKTPGPLTIGETYEMVDSALRGWPVRASGGAAGCGEETRDAGPPAL